MLGKPGLNFPAFVENQVVADDMNERDGTGSVAIDRIEQLDELLLTLPFPTDSGDRTAARIKSSKQLKSAAPPVLMFQADWKSGSCRERNVIARCLGAQPVVNAMA